MLLKSDEALVKWLNPDFQVPSRSFVMKIVCRFDWKPQPSPQRRCRHLAAVNQQKCLLSRCDVLCWLARAVCRSFGSMMDSQHL